MAKILLDSQTYYGVTHVGMRPTLDNDKAISIETHIFDFDNDIYGRTMTIYLYKKIREVRKFNELSLLIEQVATDRLSARKFWGNEFEVFYMLYLSPQITFTKEQIYEKIWHEPTNNHLHAVENTVFQIRKRLKPHCKGHEYIKTVVGYGYKFNSD